MDPVVLFKLWLLGYHFNITSERQLCEEAGLNLAWRWLLGYELDEPIPNHSVLSMWPLWSVLDSTPEGRGADWRPEPNYSSRG